MASYSWLHLPPALRAVKGSTPNVRLPHNTLQPSELRDDSIQVSPLSIKVLSLTTGNIFWIGFFTIKRMFSSTMDACCRRFISFWDTKYNTPTMSVHWHYLDYRNGNASRHPLSQLGNALTRQGSHLNPLPLDQRLRVLHPLWRCIALHARVIPSHAFMAPGHRLYAL